MFENYLQQSTRKVMHTLELAVSELASTRQSLLTPDFILLALLSQTDSEAIKVLEELLDSPRETITTLIGQIRQQLPQATSSQVGQIVASQEVAEVFRLALDEAQSLGDQFIATGTLFIALFDPLAGNTSKLLTGAGLRQGRARETLKKIRGGESITSDDAETAGDVLERFTRDLTEMARQGELDPVDYTDPFPPQEK
jgi:ATP-dependent Clp protease ATP-binding subunit ClpC